MIQLMICRNRQHAEIAWSELFEWQRPASRPHMRVLYTDLLDHRPLRGVRYDESEVMFCEGWEEGQWAFEAEQGVKLLGLNPDNCGRLSYD